jgi:hypothetical protein
LLPGQVVGIDFGAAGPFRQVLVEEVEDAQGVKGDA